MRYFFRDLRLSLSNTETLFGSGPGSNESRACNSCGAVDTTDARIEARARTLPATASEQPSRASEPTAAAVATRRPAPRTSPRRGPLIAGFIPCT